MQRVLTLVALILFPPLFGCGPAEPDPQAVATEAGKCLDRGETQKAIDMLQACEERKPGNPLVTEQLAFAWAQKGDLKTAAFYFNRLAELSPDRSDALLFAAQNLQQSGDTQGAMVTYQQYLAKKPDDLAASSSFAALAAANGQYDAAIGQYSYVYRTKPSGDTALALGSLFLKKNDPKQAATWFSTALRDHPETAAQARLGLLECAMKVQNYAAAEQLVATLRKENPGAIEASSMKEAPVTLTQWRARLSEEAAAKKRPAPQPAKAPAPAATAPATTGATPSDAAAPVIEVRREDGTVVAPAPAAPRHKSKAEAVAEELAAEEAADAQAAGGDSATAAAPAPAVQTAPVPLKVTPPAAVPLPPPPPPPVPPLLASARDADKAGRTDEAIRLYRNYLARDNQNADAWNEFSVTALKAGDTGQALAASLEATRIAPNNTDYALQYLRVTQKVYDPRRAMNEIIAMKKRFPNSPVLTLALARAYWQVDKNAVLSRAMYNEYLMNPPKGVNLDAVKAERDALPPGF